MEASARETAMGSARTHMPDTARARSHIYGFLAAVFRVEPTNMLLRELKKPELRSVFSGLGVDLGADFFEMPEEELAEELAMEYARLFLGPGKHISPHESVHHEVDGGGWGALWGEETVKVQKFIETAGLEYVSDYSGIPDHVSVELEFLQKLSLAEAGAWGDGNGEKASYGMRIEKMFIDRHLSEWVPIFCDKVIQHAHLPFYREMATLTKNFLAFEQGQLQEYLALSGEFPE